jgi:menaquinol-cytochrome c reductase iron-sulfur subunit
VQMVPPIEGAHEDTSRRNFHVVAIYGICAAISAALGLPALAYLLFPPKVKKGEEWIEVGDIARLAPNAPVELTFRRTRVDGWKVISEKSTAWVVKSADNQVTAFGPQCTHLGCAYHWEPGKGETGKGQFLCPCHTSLFSMDGSVAAGPAPRALDRYQTKVEGGKLLLGKLREAPAREKKS